MDNYFREINKVRATIIDRTLLVSNIFLVIVLVPSLFRVLDIGWKPIFSIHIGVIALSFLLLIFKRKIPLQLKTHILLGLYFLVAVVGFLYFRIASGSLFILVVISIGTLVSGKKTGILYLSSFILIASLIGYLHINHIINNNIDFNQYTTAYASWATNLASYLFAGIVIIDVLNLYYKFFKRYIKDITFQRNELSETYKTIKLSEERYQSIFQGSNDGFIFINKDCRIINCNDSFLAMIGYNREELIGEKFCNLLKDPDNCENYLSKLKSQNCWGEPIEINFLRNTDTILPVEITSFTLDDNEIFFWSVVKDLREKKDLEEQIFATMIHSEEKERERYARELHDGLGPYLSTAMIYVNTITQEEKKELIDEYAKKTHGILYEAAHTIKEISNNLSPHVLIDYGIAEALSSFIEKTHKVLSINFSINNKLSGRFNELIEISVYRALIELVNNSIKYSGAKNIMIDLIYIDQNLHVSYNEDGTGFNYQEMRKKQKGFGLANIEYRIKKLNGEFIYTTAPGEGVKAQCILTCNYR